MAKISKLNKLIDKNERKIAKHQEKLLKAKELSSLGEITKAKYYKLKNKHSKRIRAMRDDIRRKKKARQTLMKKEKEKKDKKSFFF